ncbi:MAG TPA: asparagine synthase (glutamine-hydrolyzing) [Cyclobacteriaceae bacterium]|nr:asparagine synthase (glutamine-hydrolyzing) [Cyclobacteriaceae bacterium]
MCGLAGFCDFNKKTNRGVVKGMMDVIVHRGPDDEGFVEKDLPEAFIALGFRRLSILELSPLGHQPYVFKNISLTFNGEIYNFKEVRQKLIALGYTFVSNGDTEVIIKAYDAWGIDCLKEFIGMFGLVILDEDKRKLFLVRDRAGVKPMHYYWKNDVLIFGSELKSFHQHPSFVKEMDTDALALYFQYSYIPVPYTIYRNTHKLRPGHYLEVDLKTKNLTTTCYWDVVDAYNKPKLTLSYADAEAQLETLLKSACEYRMVSDVPVGIFLSGGYDSTTVAALLQHNRTEKLKTFTIGFEEAKYNEAPHAKKVANHLGTDHYEHYCTHQEAFNIIPRLPDIYDEPLGDNSVIPTTLVSQVARRQVTVALSADGGDEIFAGYTKFNMSLHYSRQFPSWMMSTLSAGMNLFDPRFIPGTSKAFNFRTRYEKMKQIWRKQDPVFAMKIISQFNTDYELKRRMAKPFKRLHSDFDLEGLNEQNTDIDKMLAIDFRTFLIDNNLTKVDRATMSVSLEGREPLLDHRIVEFVAQLPSEYKMAGDRNKVILKNIVHKYVPQEIMDRPKMGFIVPIMNWFRKEMRDLLMENLSEAALKRDGIFNTRDVISLRDRYLSGHAENVQKLWHLLVFQMWRNRWL